MELKIPTMKSLQALPWGKIIIGLIILYIIWQTTQGKTLFEILGFSEQNPAKDTALEREKEVGFKDAKGESQTVELTNDIKTLVKSINTWYPNSTAIVQQYGTTAVERCKIASQILNIDDTTLSAVCIAYHKSYGVTVKEAMEGILADPCSYFGESNYDKAIARLENLKITY